ncbi:MAG TPA: DEAD/DEAH box helicase [Steroidobacteraceae bacterium]|nr:DEAD/DEAH box helicase [Steroidobacteraceae bacterium]
MSNEQQLPGFRELGLSAPLLEALAAVGYETPSPIQAQTIPLLLSGSDLLGQAQTGTGKTAAFALPILAQIDLSRASPQALVLVPTRELAIQVAEAFQRYAAHLQGFHVLPIYGGQSYVPQLKGLKRGAHVIVGTPGRVMDHMKRGVLQVDTIRFIVLDEGDEMLQMGFVEAIEWILEQAPPKRQIALFSATLPAAIRRIAHTHMREPAQITIQNRASTTPKIRQRYWLVSGLHKLDALTRVLEAERFEAMLIFVRTKLETTELAERLEARGFNVAALHGDIPQPQRERTIARLKAGQVDIVVATDVAARGLDVERISHVVNYDIPYDSQTYVHRIGRTGRAGRNGAAILFVAPRERNMLRIIERATKQPIEQMQLPSVADVNEQRILKFKESVANAVRSGEGKVFQALIEEIEREQNLPAIEVAAALASLLQGPAPFLLTPKPGAPHGVSPPDQPRDEQGSETQTAATGTEPVSQAWAHHGSRKGARLETYRIEVGHSHGVQPGNIVGAIANEADLEGRYIGHIDIRGDHSFVDLPEGMPEETFASLETVRVRGVELRISRVASKPGRSERRPHAHGSPRAPGRKRKGPPQRHSAKRRGKPPRR